MLSDDNTSFSRRNKSDDPFIRSLLVLQSVNVFSTSLVGDRKGIQLHIMEFSFPLNTPLPSPPSILLSDSDIVMVLNGMYRVKRTFVRYFFAILNAQNAAHVRTRRR